MKYRSVKQTSGYGKGFFFLWNRNKSEINKLLFLVKYKTIISSISLRPAVFFRISKFLISWRCEIYKVFNFCREIVLLRVVWYELTRVFQLLANYQIIKKLHESFFFF